MILSARSISLFTAAVGRLILQRAVTFASELTSALAGLIPLATSCFVDGSN